MQASHQARAAVVGRESRECLRLADLLRELIGRENVFRQLETEHLLQFVEVQAETPLVVFVDIFSFELQDVTQMIGEIRARYPRVVFSLYLDPDEWKARRAELPREWFDRLGHYFRLHKVPDDEEFDPIVRQAFRQASREAQHNFGHEPIQFTPRFDAGVLAPDPPDARRVGKGTVFVSYSRDDWAHAVSPLVQRLQHAGFQLWVDQGFLVGGEDWMDVIGEALTECSVCLLAVSPEALESRYVKMEYRFFLNNDKTIVPIIVRRVDKLPFELSGIQYIDLTIESPSNYDVLQEVLARA